MSKYFVSLITGNAGIIVRWLAGLIVAGIITLLAHFGWSLDPDSLSKLAAAVTLAVAGALGEYASKLNTNGIAEIQTAFAKVSDDVQKDGHAGDVTIATAQQIVSEVKTLRASK